MAYDNPFLDPNRDTSGITDPNNPAGVYPPPPTPPPAAPTPPPQPQGGYDLEKFRKAWYGQGDVNNIQGWLDQHKDITSGVTLKNEKAYDPSGRFIADLVGNYNNPAQKRTAIFLDYVDSKGKPRPGNPNGPKISGPISPPGPGNLPKPAPTPTPKPTVPGVPTTPTVPGESVAPIKDPRLDELYNLLMGRAEQGLNVDRNNPVVRQQADAFSANTERSRRNYLGDLAESSGPNANLRNEQRLTAERAGQASGAFEGELMGRELQAKRQEISEALTSMQGLLTTEQTLALQNKLAQLDDATRRLGLGNQNNQFYANLKQQESQFGRSLSQAEKQFLADLGYRNRALDQNDAQFRDRLGFDYGDRSNYWDSIYRGLI